jgi:hypothetical protein
MRLSHITALLSASLSLTSGHAPAPPCSTPTPQCTEWLILSPSSARVLLFRSFSLETRNTSITRALVVVHGALRDASTYYEHALAAAFLAGALQNTVIIAVRFPSTNGPGCADSVADRELTWHCVGPGRWTVGGPALSDESTTTFDVVDELLRRLASKAAFPSLRVIVLAGHSAGGQFISRYQMANQVHETLGVPLRYVIANPSAYTYLDSLRPSVAVFSTTVSALGPGYVVTLPTPPPDPFIAFSDAPNCTTYNDWPYGLHGRVGYAARLPDDRLQTQLAARGAEYLLGGLDILPLFGFDASCPANAQGPTRLARGLAFGRYVHERYGAKHDVLVIPACGHNARCMFTDNAALGWLFPKD